MSTQLYLPGTPTHEELAIERLKTFEPPEGYYLAFSGGKDSIVLMDLARRSGVRFDAHHHLTGIDPPELVRFVRDVYPDVPRERAGVTMWQLIAKEGYPPTRRARGLETTWADADAVFNWWMDETRHPAADDAQCELFGGGMA